MFWPTLTHYGWAVSIRTAGQFVALQVDSFHHNGWRYWVRIRTVPARLDSDMDWVLLPEGRDVDKGIAKRKKVERIIGANAYQVIEACIREAATQKKIVGLRNEKIDGRYVCDKTRLELAQSLRRRFRKKVIYEESTVVRVLSDFVACPRHRKGFRK